MAVESMPMMMEGIEGVSLEEAFLSVDGEMGSHTITVDMSGPLADQVELLSHLFQLAASMPNLTIQTKFPEGKVFTIIPQNQTELTQEIETMLQEVEGKPVEKKSQQTDPKATSSSSRPTEANQKPEVHCSLFSLARAMNSAAPKAQPRIAQQIKTQAQPFTAQPAITPTASKAPEKVDTHLRVDEREGGGQQKRDQQQEREQQKKRHKMQIIAKSKGKRSSSGATHAEPKEAALPLGSIENIYVRFLALMARILGQAEAEAHQLYNKIKARTDQIDTLSLLMAKVNNSPKKIDWSKDEEMRQLVDRAREIGVTLPEGKYTWNENEKHLLKENIQMRKDSMEKLTQLERTDMQRYLQEASQCHQARSNVLKLLKEVVDTIVHNMRGA